jgi:hypothetical protein
MIKICANAKDRLEHVQLAVPAGGEALARAFYRDVLGIPEIPKPSSAAAVGSSGAA